VDANVAVIMLLLGIFTATDAAGVNGAGAHVVAASCSRHAASHSAVDVVVRNRRGPASVLHASRLGQRWMHAHRRSYVAMRLMLEDRAGRWLANCGTSTFPGAWPLRQPRNARIGVGQHPRLREQPSSVAPSEELSGRTTERRVPRLL
jgi:hypothetical protein